ncbi:MAG TPA: hypothetical protein VEA19_01975 [Actinomycetota bacterium]|nr:hypothetical protein [Actinomycetota bacterium]
MNGRRIVSAAALAVLVLGPVPSAYAKTSASNVEGTNWFWQSQNRTAPSEVTGEPVCPPPQVPVCPDPQVGASSPHEPGALPVMVFRNQDEKISSILFQMPFQRAKISKFDFTVIESKDPRDQIQTQNAGGKIIQACRITEVWTPSEDGADEIGDAPKYDKSGCVDGKRETPSSGARWRFNITSLVNSWGDPGRAFGVMLVGKKGNDANDTWQIVLKGPRRDDATTPANEATANAKNVQANVSFTPIKGGGGSGGGGFGGGFGFPSSSGGFSPDYTSSGTGTPDFGVPFAPPVPPTEAVPGSIAATPAGASGSEKPKGPELPPIFWLMIPVGLMALSMVRNIVLEPRPGKRADGVVALIRNHNAARLGRTPAPDAHSPFSGVTRTLQSAGGRLRGLVRRVITGGAS